MIPAPGAALIRVAAYPNDLHLPGWPDLASDEPEQWRTWLHAVWKLPRFATAVTSAAPELAGQIARAVAGEPVAEKRLRRLVGAAVKYLLRWTTRATPFGTFAGVAPIQFDTHAAVRLGEAHRAVARPDGEFIAEHTARAEQDLATLRAVEVVTNSLGFQRDGRWVLPCARAEGDRRWDVEIRLTGPVEAAIQAARSPVGFADLAAKIAGPADVATAERLLADLVQVGVLLSALRPAMTVTDPAAHAADHYALPQPGHRIAVDLRADVAVTHRRCDCWLRCGMSRSRRPRITSTVPWAASCSSCPAPSRGIACGSEPWLGACWSNLTPMFVPVPGICWMQLPEHYGTDSGACRRYLGEGLGRVV